jgi:hypothetical protein
MQPWALKMMTQKIRTATLTEAYINERSHFSWTLLEELMAAMIMLQGVLVREQAYELQPYGLTKS